MTKQPKISIVIPVYNVEKYLAECLDSVVNQTMREIQIICVNDGSPDNSRAILQEYADRDSRIEIIDKPNGGLSSARNAAYPSINGKYTMFLDSDDWIELDSCEKLFAKAEQTGAEIVVFFYRWEDPAGPIDHCSEITPQDKTTIQEKTSLFNHNSSCWKLWRSDFLRDNHLFFPEGLYFEDNLVCWQGVVMAKRISVVPEHLYHYRSNPASICRTLEKTGFDFIPICTKIGKFLRECGYYDDWRDVFICYKLSILYRHFCNMPQSCHSKYLSMLRKSLTKDDREYCCDILPLHPDKNLREFYLSHGFGGLLGMQKYHSELQKEFNTENSCFQSEMRQLQEETVRLQSEMLRLQGETLRLQSEILRPAHKITRFHYNKYRLLSNITWGKLREKYLAKKRAVKIALGIK